MQRDVSAIEAKIRELTTQAEEIVEKYPEDKSVTEEELARLNEKFGKLSDALKLREEKLGQAGNLQTFLRDMAEFQVRFIRNTTGGFGIGLYRGSSIRCNG